MKFASIVPGHGMAVVKLAGERPHPLDPRHCRSCHRAVSEDILTSLLYRLLAIRSGIVRTSISAKNMNGFFSCSLIGTENGNQKKFLDLVRDVAWDDGYGS